MKQEDINYLRKTLSDRKTLLFVDRAGLEQFRKAIEILNEEEEKNLYGLYKRISICIGKKSDTLDYEEVHQLLLDMRDLLEQYIKS